MFLSFNSYVWHYHHHWAIQTFHTICILTSWGEGSVSEWLFLSDCMDSGQDFTNFNSLCNKSPKTFIQNESSVAQKMEDKLWSTTAHLCSNTETVNRTRTNHTLMFWMHVFVCQCVYYWVLNGKPDLSSDRKNELY